MAAVHARAAAMVSLVAGETRPRLCCVVSVQFLCRWWVLLLVLSCDQCTACLHSVEGALALEIWPVLTVLCTVETRLFTLHVLSVPLLALHHMLLWKPLLYLRLQAHLLTLSCHTALLSSSPLPFCLSAIFPCRWRRIRWRTGRLRWWWIRWRRLLNCLNDHLTGRWRCLCCDSCRSLCTCLIHPARRYIRHGCWVV